MDFLGSTLGIDENDIYYKKYNSIINGADVSFSLIKYKESVIKLMPSLLALFNVINQLDFFKILYCIITDAYYVESMNQAKCMLDIYDPILDRFIIIQFVNNDNRFITINSYNIDVLYVIFDYNTKTNSFKLYELFNPYVMKKYYGSKK